ncbi:PST family polysaccharide transporter [Sphingomonas zeicaulis]|uniref:oligosaccharide flippase family protein n=1 Tax=Sphingomonas zeicaulis TaxID=1632740 RepID=UPI003D1FF6B1
MLFGPKFRSAAILAMGRVTDIVFPLLRAFLLARLLPQEQFGLAITLSVMAALVELSTDIGLDRYAVVNADRESAVRRGTMHSLSVLRGALIGLLLAVTGPLAGWAFDSPQAWWAFSMLGVASFIRGFMHLGVKEAMRDFRFWPEGVTLASAQISWTAISVGLAWYLNDYRCMLFGILGAQVVFVLVSHLVSRSDWSLRWSPEDATTILKFSLPLVPNGMSLALRHMADRLIVGAFMSLTAAAIYNVNMMIALTPRNIIQSFVTSVTLPLFAQHESGEKRIAGLYPVWAMALAVTGAVYGAGVICLAEPIVSLIFGPKFSIDQIFMTLTGIMVAIKIIYGLPVPPSLAVGDTKFILFGTVAALGSPLFGVVSASITPNLNIFVAAMCLGEFLGLVSVAWRCTNRYGFKVWDVWLAVLVPVAMLAALGTILYETAPGLIMRIVSFAVFAGLCGGAVAFAAVRSGIDLKVLLRRKPRPAKPQPAE